MADTKKEQERAALHATIWRIANDMRGSVDGWDFKTYVLGILFYSAVRLKLTILKKQHTSKFRLRKSHSMH